MLIRSLRTACSGEVKAKSMAVPMKVIEVFSRSKSHLDCLPYPFTKPSLLLAHVRPLAVWWRFTRAGTAAAVAISSC